MPLKHYTFPRTLKKIEGTLRVRQSELSLETEQLADRSPSSRGV